MKTIKVMIIKGEDGAFWCRSLSPIAGIELSACGDTIAEAKEDLLNALELVKEHTKEKGENIPAVSFSYEYDMQSFFKYFNVLNITETARKSGINPSLLRQYVSGTKKAGEKTYKKLSKYIEDLSKELASACLR